MPTNACLRAYPNMLMKHKNLANGAGVRKIKRLLVVGKLQPVACHHSGRLGRARKSA